MFFVKRKPNLFQEEVLLESEHFYLPASLFDIRCVMIQTPFRFCIQFLTDDIEFERLQLYFEGLVKLGNGSALRGVELAKRGRERASRRGKREDSTEIIDGIDSQEEIIAFS